MILFEIDYSRNVAVCLTYPTPVQKAGDGRTFVFFQLILKRSDED